MLSVALSLGSRRAEVIRRLVSLEPGLSSNGRLPHHQRLPGRLVIVGYIAHTGAGTKPDRFLPEAVCAT